MTNIKIAVITSRFNEDVTSRLQSGALARLKEKGVMVTDKDIFSVPGAVEIPVLAQALAKKGVYHSILCLGAVIRGETTHYDYVCQQVSDGCLRVALDTGIPVIFGILTTENEEQALDRCGGAHGHKGADCADAAIEMAGLINSLK